MSQKAFLAGLDAALHASFAAAGMADAGVYFEPDAAQDADGAPCRVYVDRDLQTVGELRQFKVGRVEVTYVLPDVTPKQRGRVVVDGDSYFNEDRISDDGSLSRWLVRRG